MQSETSGLKRDTILDVILTELIAEVVDTGLVDHE